MTDSIMFIHSPPPQLNTDSVQNTLALQHLDLPQYVHLFVPGVEWILQCIAHQAPEVRGGGGGGGGRVLCEGQLAFISPR